ncbi:Ribonuclease H-like superfamily [Arabidopsis thaliana x Arabidopsis arenosa]|uniref:Ribonuclease H-like superfamily n=1 Tax=Arabidopsis thaliana x Arabidopsis arenosa TaxID=1240361 RepID=A0A8T2A6G2_9BRAS|nr:Ribonuclease H-like superfamily [Arabidopsis thaliana x Arabidopsis arenosa]
MFDNVDSDPLQVLRLAEKEAQLWQSAQIELHQENNYSVDLVTRSRVGVASLDSNYSGYRCFVDGSWKESDKFSGAGWFCTSSDGEPPTMGAANLRRSLSPLHTEFEALLWAMKCMIGADNQDVAFLTDCSDLVKMVSSPTEWPAFSVYLEEFQSDKEEFSTFSLSLISQESTSQDTVESTPSSSVDRHWVRTAPYALVFPPTTPVYTPPVRFPKKRRSKEEFQDARCKAIMEKILTTIPTVNPETSSPPLERYVKRLVNNAKKERKKKVVVSEHITSIIRSRMPEKIPDPGSIVLDCSISTGWFRKSLCDFGSNINLMPHSVVVRLGMTAYRPTQITLLLADRSKRIPEGILQDVPVKIATAGAKIDVKKGHISLDVCDVQMKFDMKGSSPPLILSGKSFSVESTRESATELGSPATTQPETAQLATQQRAETLISARIVRGTTDTADCSGAVPELYSAPRPRFPRLDQ